MSKKNGSGTAQQYGVEKYGVEDEVLKLYKDKTPATKISQILKKKGIKLSPLAINRWLTKEKESVGSSKNVEIKKSYEVMVMDYKAEITNILEEVKEVKKVAKDNAINDGKLDGYVKVVGKLYQGIELLAKLMGDIKPKGNNFDINIIINEINKQTFDNKKDLRNKIHNTPQIIDVEAEIIDEDNKRKDELNGDKQ